MVRHGNAEERSARTIALFGSLIVLLIGTPVGIMTAGAPGVVAPLAVATLLCARYEFLVRRVRRRMSAQRPCLQCGYTLVQTRSDNGGSGRCPECGHAFEADAYRC